jgi:hypothetical protein
MELYLHSSNTPPWRGGQLKHRDNNYLRNWTSRCHLEKELQKADTVRMAHLPQTDAIDVLKPNFS